MKKKTKLIFLSLLLVSVVAGGVFFFTKGTSLQTAKRSEPTDSSTSSVVPTAANTEAVTYTEKVVGENYDLDSRDQQILYNHKGNPLLFGAPGNRFVSLDTQKAAFALPQNLDFGSMSGLCVDGKENLWIAFYDQKKKQFFLRNYDKTGKELNHTVYLPEYKLMTKYPTESITRLAADDSFFYLYYQDRALLSDNHKKENSYLQVFDRSGKQVLRRDYVNAFDIDYEGNLYLNLQNAKADSLEKYNVKAQKTVWACQRSNSIAASPSSLWYIPSTKTLYEFFYQGVCRCTDNLDGGKTAPTDFSEIFKVGTDSSFTASEYHNNDEKVMFDYAADEKGRLYFLAGELTKDSEHQFPFYCGTVYQFTPEAIPKNISYAFTVTGPYRSDFLKDAAARYEKTHTGTHIKLDCAYETESEYNANIEQYSQRLTTQILSNDIGDVVMLGSTNLPYSGNTFRTDAFVDLTGRIENDPNAKDLNQNVLNGIRQGGAIRALPVSVQYHTLDVNLTFMKQTGVDVTGKDLTWGNLLQIAQNWSDRKTGNTLFAKSDKMISDYYFRFMLTSNLPDLVDMEKKTVRLNQPWFLDLLKQYKRLAGSENFLRRQVEAKDETSRWPSLQNNILLYPTSLSINPDDKSSFSYMFYEYTEKSGIEHTLIPMPCGEKNANREASSQDLFSISSHSKKQQEAWDFLSFLLTPAVQRFSSLNGVPLNLSAEKNMKPHALTKIQEENYDKMAKPIYVSVDKMFYSTDVLTAMLSPLKQYVGGQLSLDDAVMRAQQSVERTLNA